MSQQLNSHQGSRAVGAAIAFSGCVLGMAVSVLGRGDSAEFSFIFCFLLAAMMVLAVVRTQAGSIRPADIMDWLLPQPHRSPDDD